MRTFHEKILFLQLIILQHAALLINVQSFSPPTLGLGAIFFRPKNIVILPNQGQDAELIDAAKFFTAAFWTGKVGGAAKLSEKQIKYLSNSQIAEFRKRYGVKFMSKTQDRRSELVVCKNQLSNEIYGCAGIEVSDIKTSAGSGLKVCAPLMSNLAVGRQFRRRGIAELLVKATEDIALKEWGYKECYLYVEKRNIPALKLYKKLGYQVQWEDENATTLVPTTQGSVVTRPTVILCMRKVLGVGLFGRILSRSS